MSGNVSKNIRKKAPKIGELINPIVLAKKETTPDGDVGFNRTLKVYRSAMAKIVERIRQTSDPELDFNEDVTHEFIIRTHIGEKIDRYVDVVLHDSMLYQVQYVHRLVDGMPYTVLICTEYMPIADYEYTAEIVAPEEKSNDDNTQFPDFGKW